MPSIPPELNAIMDDDPFYEQCCLTGMRPVQRHHNFIYGRNALNELWCILPVHKTIHDIEKRRDIRERLDWIMLNRADEATLEKYSKVDSLAAKRGRLNEKYGVWQST